jgi:hypothetical protein
MAVIGPRHLPKPGGTAILCGFAQVVAGPLDGFGVNPDSPI